MSTTVSRAQDKTTGIKVRFVGQVRPEQFSDPSRDPFNIIPSIRVRILWKGNHKRSKLGFWRTMMIREERKYAYGVALCLWFWKWHARINFMPRRWM